MSHEFSPRFNQFWENKSEKPKDNDIERLYPSPGHMRNLCFVWPSGRKQSFNYAYLVTHEYDPEESVIFLEFTSHTVILKGYCLENIYYELLDQRNRLIFCTEARYAEIEEGQTVILEIIVQKNS